MTNVVIGVDLGGLYENAVLLLKKLEFNDLKPHWVHCVESVLPGGDYAPIGPSHPIGQIMEDRASAGRELLANAQLTLPGGEAKLFHGDPVRILKEESEKVSADLVVVGSERKGYFGSLFFGSVTKGLLTHSTTDFLVVKKAPISEGKLKVVLATDHSPYADQCVDELIRINPRGFGEIHVITAAAPNLPSYVGDSHHQAPDIQEAIIDWEKMLHHRSEAIAEKLKALAPTVTISVKQGHANDVISNRMKEVGADLLIMGAKGHGFLERLGVGSVSFHQVVNDEHSVLLLRAP